MFQHCFASKSQRRLCRLVAVGAFSAALYVSTTVAAHELPQFDKVLHGYAKVAAQGNTMTIKGAGTGKNSVLRWHSFDVGKTMRVDFSRGNFLNLIYDKKASDIFGTVRGQTGSQLYFVNPRGINLHKGALLEAGGQVGFSTAKITPQLLNSFKQGSLINSADLSAHPFFSAQQGMGKVRLLGQVHASNLLVDAGQIIIRDASKLREATGTTPLGGKDYRAMLQSSVGRIDVGFISPDDGSAATEHYIDLKQNYEINAPTQIVEHREQIPISDESELVALKDSSASFWLTNDLNVDTNVGGTFKGKLDGAFNAITLHSKLQTADTEGGLFAKLQRAKISNLRLDGELEAAAAGGTVSAGALAGEIADSVLKNIEVSEFSVQRELKAGDAIGALSGKLTGNNSLTNVTAGFSAANAMALAGGSGTLGAISGWQQGTLGLAGVVAGLNGGTLKAIGQRESELSLADSFKAGLQSAAVTFQDDYVCTAEGSTGHLKGFLQPLFINNMERVYDGSSDNYAQLNAVSFEGTLYDEYGIAQGSTQEHTVFALADYISYDNTCYSADGNVRNAGNYSYALTNQDGFAGFYVVQPQGADGTSGAQSLNGTGYIKIHPRPLGTIEVGDAIVQEGDTLPTDIAIGGELNFAPGESLSDFNPQVVYPQGELSAGEYELGFSADGLNVNYTYTVNSGTLTVMPQPEPEPEPEPAVHPDLPPKVNLLPLPDTGALTALAVPDNVTPCDYCKGRERLQRLLPSAEDGKLSDSAATSGLDLRLVSCRELASRSLQAWQQQRRLAAASKINEKEDGAVSAEV